MAPSQTQTSQETPASRLLSAASFLDQTLTNWHQSETGRTDALTRNLSLWQDLLQSEDHTDAAPALLELALTALERTKDALANPTFEKIEQLAHLNRELAAHFCAPRKRGW